MAGGTKSPQISPDGKWWWDGVSWRPIAHPAFAVAKRAFDWAVVAMFCWAALPVGLAVVLAILEPSYWAPMFSTTTGIGLLAVGIVAIGVSVALAGVARRVARPSRGGLLAGLGIIMVAFLVEFIWFWIVLLGPALVIVLSPRQP
jgi:hypothetical protein